MAAWSPAPAWLVLAESDDVRPDSGEDVLKRGSWPCRDIGSGVVRGHARSRRRWLPRRYASRSACSIPGSAVRYVPGLDLLQRLGVAAGCGVPRRAGRMMALVLCATSQGDEAAGCRHRLQDGLAEWAAAAQCGRDRARIAHTAPPGSDALNRLGESGDRPDQCALRGDFPASRVERSRCVFWDLAGGSLV